MQPTTIYSGCGNYECLKSPKTPVSQGMLKFGKNEATICSGKKHILCLFQKLFLFKFGFMGQFAGTP